MPLAFASILVCTCTLIARPQRGVSGYIKKVGCRARNFQITRGLDHRRGRHRLFHDRRQRLLPDRKASVSQTNYAMREYVSEIIILPDSLARAKKLHSISTS